MLGRSRDPCSQATEMNARIERFETSAMCKRELAFNAMNEAEIPKVAVADFSVAAPGNSNLPEEAKIPGAYWKPHAHEVPTAKWSDYVRPAAYAAARRARVVYRRQ